MTVSSGPHIPPGNVTFAPVTAGNMLHFSMLVGCRGRITDHPQGAGETGDIRRGFDSRRRLEFHGSKIGFDGGPLLFRELDETPGLHDIAGGPLGDTRTVHNRLHSVVGLRAIGRI